MRRFQSHHLPRPAMLVGILTVGLIGAYYVLASHAATPDAAFEPELGTISSPAAVTSNSSASGGAAVQFGPASSTPGNRTVNVSTGAELTAAIANAQPGDTIHLADGSYTGKLAVGSYTGAFSVIKSGTANAPITLTGSRNAIIDAGGTGSHYGLYLVNANYWNIVGITVTNATKGIVMDGCNHLTLDGVRVFNIGQEAVHFRAFSSDNIIKNSLVEQTGVKQAQYGEGVYIGSANSNWATYSGGQPDASLRNQVINNAIQNTGAENIDIKEGTTDGVISGNHFDGIGIAGENSADSWIDVKGNNYTITGNTGVVSGPSVFQDGFQVHQALVGWGNNNSFHGNTLTMPNAPGYGFYQQKGVTGNIIGCDNVVTGAGSGFVGYNVATSTCNN